MIARLDGNKGQVYAAVARWRSFSRFRGDSSPTRWETDRGFAASFTVLFDYFPRLFGSGIRTKESPDFRGFNRGDSILWSGCSLLRLRKF